STGATSYRVEVSTKDNFPPGQIIKGETTSGTSTTVSGLSNQTAYYWRVSASNSTGTSDWSEVRNFTVASATTTSAEEIGDAIPSEFRLSQNYPNPFNPSTTIEFSLPKSSYVKVLIYNTLGHLIHTLVDEILRPGIYRKPWVATGVASGVYFYRIQADGFVETKRLVLVK
ncbi:MAG: T9SS type A sorting domain-containing protein, partial [Bacteroidota bacterium]